MAYKHGVYVEENPTSIIPPITSDSGVQVVVGKAPIHLTKDPISAVNKPILINSWKEAVENFGYSDNWEKYNLCEVMDWSLRRKGVGPLVFINVLDPEEHSTQETDSKSFANGEVTLEREGILPETIVIKNQEGGTTYEKGIDYIISVNSDNLPVVIALEGGGISEESVELNFEYSVLDPDLVDDDDIIGGYDINKEQYEGLELVTRVYPRLGIVPGLIISPGYSHKIEVATVMDVKSELINGSFNCMNVLDIDSEVVTSYQGAPSWKNQNSYTSKNSILGWPKAKIGDRVYWMSTVIAGEIAYTDATNENIPNVSPSNKRLPISGTVLASGKEVTLDQPEGNFLNGEGIVTAINMSGWRLWGNNTAAYPNTTDPKDRFIPIRRVFDWWGNTFILTYFQKVDDPTNFRLIESVVASENIRGNGFKARDKIAGAKIEFRREDNPITSILDGRIQFIQKIGAFPPAKEIVNVLEYDPGMLEDNLFGGGQ